jgi:putative glycosyltransferase (TIGR04372 family)
MKRKIVALIFLPLILLLYLISPVLLIRIGGIRSDRLGHLALDLELCLCSEANDTHLLPRRINLFYVTPPISNDYLLKLWKRKILIFPRHFLYLLDVSIKSFSFFQKHNFFNLVDLYGHTNLSILDNSIPTLSLTSGEIKQGKNLLQQLGIPADQQFVCLAVRDDRYLNEFLPQKNWSYHDFRDSNIQDYLQMAEYLTQRGFFVIRMGKLVQQELKTSNPMIIDYANSLLRSDFADVYLFANCSFCISTSTGMDALASIFRRPIGLVNIVNIESVASGNIIKLFQPKSFFDTRLKRELNFKEISARNLFYFSESSKFLESDIVLKENSPEELRLFAGDLLQIISEDQLRPSIKSESNFISERLNKISHSWLSRHLGYFN